MYSAAAAYTPRPPTVPLRCRGGSAGRVGRACPSPPRQSPAAFQPAVIVAGSGRGLSACVRLSRTGRRPAAPQIQDAPHEQTRFASTMTFHLPGASAPPRSAGRGASDQSQALTRPARPIGDQRRLPVVRQGRQRLPVRAAARTQTRERRAPSATRTVLHGRLVVRLRLRDSVVEAAVSGTTATPNVTRSPVTDPNAKAIAASAHVSIMMMGIFTEDYDGHGEVQGLLRYPRRLEGRLA